MPPSWPLLPRNPVVDTNILFDFLLWQFCVETPTPIDPSRLHRLSSEHLKDALRWYLNEAKPIQTSTHVIAEIHGLLRSRAKFNQPKLGSFWKFAREELARLQLEEHLVTIREMSGRELELLGPTDTSILELARRSGSTVLTDDGELRGRCASQGIRVKSRYEILALWQEQTV